MKEDKIKEEAAAREYGQNKSTERFVCTLANIRNNAITDFKAGIEWRS